MTARRIFWGSALVLVGLLLLASNLGYLQPFSFWGLWPILIIWPALRVVFGRSYVTVGLNNRRQRVWTGAGLGTRVVALWILAGATAELLHNLHLIDYGWGFMAYWTLPILLVGLGLAILARPRHFGRHWCWCGGRAPHWTDADWEGGSVSSFAGDLRLGRCPWDFKSPMKVDLWAGDIDLDLSTARFEPGDNHLYVSAWAADVDIKAPEGIEVKAEASCSAGQITIFGRERSGLGVANQAVRPARDGREADWAAEEEGRGASKAGSAAGEGVATGGDPATGQPRLFIHVDLTFGDVDIR